MAVKNRPEIANKPIKLPYSAGPFFKASSKRPSVKWLLCSLQLGFAGGLCVISFSFDVNLDINREKVWKYSCKILRLSLTRRICASSCTPPCGSSGRTAASPSRTCRSNTVEGVKKGFVMDDFENVNLSSKECPNWIVPRNASDC